MMVLLHRTLLTPCVCGGRADILGSTRTDLLSVGHSQMTVIAALSTLICHLSILLQHECVVMARWLDTAGHSGLASAAANFGCGEDVGALLALGALHLLERHGRLRLRIQILQVESHDVLRVANDGRGRHDLTEALRSCLQVMWLIHELANTAASSRPTGARFKRVRILMLWSVAKTVLRA